MKVVPIWVTLQNVPRSLFSWEGLSLIASAIGFPKRLHPDTETCVRFEEAKILIEADLTKELPQVFLAQDTDGLIKKINFVYPKIPQFCFSCQQWGHLAHACPVLARREETSLQPSSTQTQTQQLPSAEELAVSLQPSTSVPVATLLHNENNLVNTGEQGNDLENNGDQGKNLNVDTTFLSPDVGPSTITNKKFSTSPSKSQKSHLVNITNAAAKNSEEEAKNSWTQVSPGKRVRSPQQSDLRQNIEISTSSFNVLYDLNQGYDEGGKKDVETTTERITIRTQTDADLVVSNMKPYATSNSDSERQIVDDVSDSHVEPVPMRPTSTRSRKPPTKYQQQVQAPRKRTQSKHNPPNCH